MKNLNVKIFSDVNLEVTESNLRWIDNMISGQYLYYDNLQCLNMIPSLFEDIDMLLNITTVSSVSKNK